VIIRKTKNKYLSVGKRGSCPINHISKTIGTKPFWRTGTS